MTKTFRALSALLDYPSVELKQYIDEIRSAIVSEAILPRVAVEGLEPLLQSFKERELTELQIRYCELFDQSRALSLHLFEHVHGENRERGQAMIDLGQQYIDHGFIMDSRELPDYLPAFLEFLSCLPIKQALEWLAQPAHVLAALEQRLHERESHYAAIFHALVALPDVKPDPQALAELQARGRAEHQKSIDETWEEAPVDFSAPLPRQEPSGIVNRIRAARDALIATSRD